MNSCFFRLFCSVIIIGSLTGTPFSAFGQEHLELPWEDFVVEVDSLISKGNNTDATLWLSERESLALQAENWDEILGCINRYSRLIELDDPEGRAEKIISNQWIVSKIPEPTIERARFTQQVGEVYLTHFRKNDSARIFVDQALSEFIQLDLWEDYAYSTILKGLSYFFEGSFEETESWWVRGLDSATVHLEEDNIAIPTVLNALSVFYTTIGDYDKSLDISKKTIDLYEQRRSLHAVDSQFLGASYINKGHLLLEMEDSDQALDHFRHAIFLFSNLSQSDPRDMISATIHEGLANWKLGKKEDAYRIWMEMLDKTENQQNYEHERMVISVYLYLSDYYLDKGENEQALNYLLRANEQETIDKSSAFQIRMDIGNLYLKTGRPDQAKIWMDQALEEVKTTFQNRNPRASLVFLGRAAYYEKLGDTRKAMEQYQLAFIELSETFNSTDPATMPAKEDVKEKNLFLRILKEKANSCKKIYLSTGEEKWLTLAANTYDLAITLLDDIRSSIRTEGSRLQLGEAAQEVYDGAIHIALIRYAKSPDQDLLKKAFSFAEKNKGLSLREALQESDAKQFAGIPIEVLEREHSLKKDLAFYRKKIFDADPSSAEDSVKIGFWQNKQFELRKAFLGLIDTLENDYPEYFELKYRDEGIKADQVMAKLAPGSALVEYFWGEDELVIFCLTKDSIWVDRQAIDNRFLAELNTFRNALIEKPSDIPEDYIAGYQALAGRSYDLYQKLIAPVMSHKNIHELLIIPDGALGYIPFEVLVKSPPELTGKPNYANLAYVFKSCKIRYEYAAAFLDHTYNGKKSNHKLLGFAPEYVESSTNRGAFTSRSSWQPLKFNQTELQQINEQMGGIPYLAGDATKSRFLTEAPEYAILHLAMHGFVNDQNPLYSGLVFSQEPHAERDSVEFGLLYAYELYNLSLKAELAVLSACNTGNGQLMEGEGIMSMARAFRYAGCPSIVTSLWSADDRATIQLMKFFYQNLAKGMEKDAALQTARTEYLASTRRDHPYYWAGFVLIGEEDEISDSSISRYVMIGAGILLLMMLIIGGRKAIRKRNS